MKNFSQEPSSNNYLNPVSVPGIIVRLQNESSSPFQQSFYRSFRVGRDNSCEVQIINPIVSRFHLEVKRVNDQWCVSDLNSRNGTFIDGARINAFTINEKITIELGFQGPKIILIPENSSAQENEFSNSSLGLTQIFKRFLLDDKNSGDFKNTIRRSIDFTKRKQSVKYLKIIALLSFLIFAVSALSIYQHKKIERQRKAAEELFYSMKTLELEVAQLDELAIQDSMVNAILQKNQSRLRELKESYNKYIQELDVYNSKLSQTDILILHTARVFNECEATIPPEFVVEVKEYIHKWQNTKRLTNAMTRAEKYDYSFRIVKEMLDHNLAPHFIYLALQESDFDPSKCGPETSYGIAKGMWQFIPSTADQYGLKLGPLFRYRQADDNDERHDFEKATKAAARYLKFLYVTEAQASGLLVIASYNWGIKNVRDLIHTLPENPKERNFWALMSRYRQQIPKETYDYVFYIFSAAVIGENPKLFGFDFENPIAVALTRMER